MDNSIYSNLHVMCQLLKLLFFNGLLYFLCVYSALYLMFYLSCKIIQRYFLRINKFVVKALSINLFKERMIFFVSVCF